mgnify:CR=1 FL=1
MNPIDLRAARKALGLTQHGLAKVLRMGKSGWQSIVRWEKDGGTVPGPVQVAVEYMLKDAEYVTVERGGRIGKLLPE